jgi:Xaa-Pro aminopeptidase
MAGRAAGISGSDLPGTATRQRLAMRVGPTALATVALIFAGSTTLAAQKDVAFPPDVYAARRAALMERVDGPIIVPSAYGIRADQGRPDPTFWYLTGVESPYAVLVLSRDSNGRVRETLFLPAAFQFAGAQYPIDDPRFRRAAWNVGRGRLEPGAAAERATGIAETWPIDELATRLLPLVGEEPTIHFARDGGVLYAPPSMGAPLSIRQQLERSVAALLPGRTIEDVSPYVDAMRLVKDAHEIAALRRAAEISVAGLLDGMRAIRPGLNDLALAGVMEAAWKREGAARASFSPIVMSGDAAVSLYTLRAERYHSTDRVMNAGELVFIDYGAAEYHTYASDICRTFPVSGRFTDEQRRYYEIVLEAQAAALDAIRPGVMMIDVIRAAAQVFRDHGLERNEDIEAMGEARVWGLMPSPTYWLAKRGGITPYSGARGTGVRDLGHDIGLEATDSRNWSRPLETGRVFTVEPKIYIPDLGIAIMIEDMILVTESGYENLSAGAPRSVAEIEAVMAGRN